MSYDNLEQSITNEANKESKKGLYSDLSNMNSRISLTSLKETDSYLRSDIETIKQMKEKAAQYRRYIAEKSTTLNREVPQIIQRAQRAEILHQENKKLALKSYLR